MFDLTKLKHIFLALIFPAPPEIRSLESLKSTEIRRTLPQSVNTPLPFVHPVFEYRDPHVRTLIKHLKYRGNKDLTKKIGEILYSEAVARLSPDVLDSHQPFILIPIPLSQKRYGERGFNQCLLLTRAIITADTSSVFTHEPSILTRTKDTAPQTSLSRSQRKTNVKNCFVVPHHKKDRVRNENVVLVDDVTTTGSTLKDARRALLEAGARSVTCVTVAH